MERILIVEDNEHARTMLCKMLERKHYDIISAVDGEEGLQKATEPGIDLILLDITLPKLNGYEVCRRLKDNKDTRLIPIVIITGMGEKEEKIKGIEAGTDDFLAKPFDQHELLVRIHSLIKSKKLNEEMENVDNILYSLIFIIDAKDSYTRRHSDRVQEVSLRLAKSLFLSKEQLSSLSKAAALHDIGKIGVSENILNKQGPLNNEEFESIKQHPCIGENLCRPLKSLKSILEIIRHHHERFDGGGYPDGIKGEEISLEAKIIAVADSYEAMSSDRPYRVKLPAEKILSELNAGKNRQWDERIVNCLIELLNAGNFNE